MSPSYSNDYYESLLKGSELNESGFLSGISRFRIAFKNGAEKVCAYEN